MQIALHPPCLETKDKVNVGCML